MKTLFSALALTASAVNAEAQDLLIRDVVLVSPGQPRSDRIMDVEIRDGRIVRIDDRIQPPVDLELIEADGAYLTPGLIDSHVHVWTTGGIRPDLIEANLELLRVFRQQEPRSYLYWGFTTLLDLNQPQARVDRWNAQDRAPQLHACRSAPYTNGYGMAFELAENRFNTPYYIYDPDEADSVPDSHDPAEHTPEAVAAKIAADGDALCIKTFHEPGFGGLFDFNTASVDVLSRVARAGEREGLVNFLHATSLESWRAGVDANVPVMAHGLWHWDELNGAARAPDTGLPPEIETLLDRVITQDMTVQLTTGVIYGELAMYDADFLERPALAHTLPPALLAWHAGEHGGWFRDSLEARIADNPGVVERFMGQAPRGVPGETSRIAMDRVMAVGRYLHRKGGRLVLASDTPSSPTYTNAPGLHGFEEMRTLEAMGLTPFEVLAAATIENARLLGLDEEIGSIEIGKQADLLLLEDDPRESVDAFNSIRTVILDGQAIARSRLSAQNFEDG